MCRNIANDKLCSNKNVKIVLFSFKPLFTLSLIRIDYKYIYIFKSKRAVFKLNYKQFQIKTLGLFQINNFDINIPTSADENFLNIN